jgi:DNA-binding transcriptional regulator YdaS (Cro superfamily)
MTTEEAKALFGGTRKLAEALGITEQAVSQWGENVPELRVYQIKVLAGEQ